MFLSIDIGGTKTLLALFSFRSLCLKRLKFPTPKSPEAFLKTLTSSLESFLSEKSRARLKAVTIAVPGRIKFEQNFCSISCPNLPWGEFDLLTPLRNLFSCKIFFANDANLATLYESSRKKAGKTVYLTFSTGIGGGLAENSHLLKSSDSFEPGHKKYLFNGKSLEWEDFASAKALSEAYSSPLSSLKLTPEIKSDLVSRLSSGLIDILKSESPDLLIVGGPLGLIFKNLKKPLLSFLEKSLKTEKSSLPELEPAHRPTESTIYGAYLYSKEHYKD